MSNLEHMNETFAAINLVFAIWNFSSCLKSDSSSNKDNNKRLPFIVGWLNLFLAYILHYNIVEF